ncbi:MAG TPA: hypothetical protein VKS21_06755, partial [Spirochaetota bacterium]|nr:hypothetical protein [Spirochaetota bacterium]
MLNGNVADPDAVVGQIKIYQGSFTKDPATYYLDDTMTGVSASQWQYTLDTGSLVFLSDDYSVELLLVNTNTMKADADGLRPGKDIPLSVNNYINFVSGGVITIDGGIVIASNASYNGALNIAVEMSSAAAALLANDTYSAQGLAPLQNYFSLDIALTDPETSEEMNILLDKPVLIGIGISATNTFPYSTNDFKIYQWTGKDWIYCGGQLINYNGKSYLAASVNNINGIFAALAPTQGLDTRLDQENFSLSANPFTPNNDGINDI